MEKSTSSTGAPARRQLTHPPSYWRTIWAAWCPKCKQECMPLLTGTCGFCDTPLIGQPTRGPYDPPLTRESLSDSLIRRTRQMVPHARNLDVAA